MHAVSRPDRPPADGSADAALRAATAVAADAAGRADVRIAEIHETTTFADVSALFDTVWGRPGEAGAVLPPEALAAIAHAGGQVSVALRDDRLVGATAAFLGRTPEGVPFLHSHVTGVVDDALRGGVGAALKWHQRAWSIARGIDEIRWTFDPLVRRNVAFNLIRLGAQVGGYLEDAYGRMQDARNAGMPTDRLVARWVLHSPRVTGAAAGRTASPDVDALRRSGADVVLDALEDGSPHVTVTDAPRRLVRIPADIEQLRVTDPDLALAWAAAVRATVGSALSGGARVSGATRDGWLVLTAGERVAELTDRPGADV
jgi:predicted GNAT superfamily acetyltransferase